MRVTLSKAGTKHISWDSESAMVSARFWNILLWEVFLVMFLYIIYHPLNINHDSALYIHCGQLLIDGRLPYVDFIDPNPPLIMYFSVIPVLIARLFSINVILVFSLLVLLLTIWSTFTIRGVILASPTKFNKEDVGVILLLWSMLSFSLGYHFGQREHLFVLLYFPFFMMRWVRWEGGKIHLPMAIVVAIAAGLGACLKPHFVFIFLAPELYWSISKRNIRNLIKPEMIIFVCVGLAYAAHFFILPDKIREGLFNRLLPLTVQRYQAYNNPFSFMVKNPAIQFAFIMALLPFLFSPIRKGGFGNITRPLAILTLASILVYFVQHKGWAYHSIPALCGAMLLLAITIIQITQHLFRDVKQIGLRSTLGLVTQVVAILATGLIYFYHAVPILNGAIIFLVITFVYIKQYLYPGAKKEGLRSIYGLIPDIVLLVALISLLPWALKRSYAPMKGNLFANIISSYTREDDPVLFISTRVTPAYPMLVQMNRRPGSRYLWSFPIALLYNGITVNATGEFPYRIEEEAPVEETRFLHELTEDIAVIQPHLIFVNNDGECQGCPKGFDIMQYLTRIGFIQKAMGGYKPLSTVSGFRVFVLNGKRRE